MYDTHYKYDNLISSKKLTLKFYTKEKVRMCHASNTTCVCGSRMKSMTEIEIHSIRVQRTFFCTKLQLLSRESTK